MSLINQVLQHVEQRQGELPMRASPWAAQVRPVLPEAVHSGTRWPDWRWLLVLSLLVLVALTWPALWQSPWQSLSSWFSSRHSVPSVEAVPVRIPAAQATVMAWDGRPQLARTLSADWQTLPDAPQAAAVVERPRAEEARLGSTAKTANTPAPVKPAQVNRPENPAGAGKLAGVEHPPAPATPGQVLKQLKPEQQANVLIQRALDHAQKGRLSEALETLRQAVAQHPQSEEARLLLSGHLFEDQQEQAAVALLQSGIASYPEQGGLRKALARWQLTHAQPAAVLTTLKPMSQMAAKDADWQWMMAMAYQQSGQHALAVSYFEQAIQLQPGQAPWYVADAMSLQALGQTATALQVLQTAQNFPMSERMADFVAQRIQQLSSQSVSP